MNSKRPRLSFTAKSAWPWVLYTFCLLLFVEVSLQSFYRLTTGAYLYVRDKPALWDSDPVSGWTNRPGLSYRHVTPEFTAEIYTNSEGFRVSSAHEEYQKKRPDNTYRILLLGPSFAFGWGVNFETTFAAQLQQILTARHFANGSRIEVLNHGVPGHPAANDLEWFNHVGKFHSPNLVIQFVYGSLEVSAKPDRSVIVRNGYAVLANPSIKDVAWAYAKNSATVFYSGIIISWIHKLFFGLDFHEQIEGAGRDMRNSEAFRREDARVTESLLFYMSLKEAVEGTGASLLIVHFPLAYVVHPEDRARWMFQGVENIEEQVQFNRTFAAYLNQIGIRCLNLTDQFIQRATMDKRRFYFWLDVHWTELGNAVAARLVGDYLQCDERKKNDKLSNCLSLEAGRTDTQAM